MLDNIKQRKADALNMTVSQLDAIVYQDKSVLHDPYLYTNMKELVDRLHAFKLEQQANPEKLLIIDTDYDTDGVMSACVLSAALDIFNINYRVHIPDMANGYGLSPTDVENIVKNYPMATCILTADNGTNAIDGVAKAKECGFTVLVTDHHLGGEKYANADVIVNPNQIADTYPFKGNAGATVAWKAMQAYASIYEPDKKYLIDDLILFAGIANVADVMPIIDENHYMVKQAVTMIKHRHLPTTQYTHYNTVFKALYELIAGLQNHKNAIRRENGKKPMELPTDEELISWYISPLLNAPRRVDGSSMHAMYALMANENNRKNSIDAVIAMNDEKSELKKEAMEQVTEDMLLSDVNVAKVKTRHGIVGLVAGQLLSDTGNATFVFADTDSHIIGSSARSTELQPLNIIMERIHTIDSSIIAGGGGHAAAAGYSIYKNKWAEFVTLANLVAGQIKKEMLDRIADDKPVIKNQVLLTRFDKMSTMDYLALNTTSVKFPALCMEILQYEQSLKPFGHGFNAKTMYIVEINPDYLLSPESNYNPNFWKTLKFSLDGVEVLTFSEDIANQIKENLNGKQVVQTFKAELKINVFNGRTSPQLVMFA